MTKAFLSVDRTPPPPEAIRGIIGLSLPEAVGHILGDISPQHLDNIVAEYKRLYMVHRTTRALPDALFDGACDCLVDLADAGYLLGVATGKSRRGLDALLAHHGIADHFVAVGCADDGPGKPHPFMLQKVMAEAGAVPAETVMIGDTIYDIAMARVAGVRGVGVAWGNHDSEALTEAGADVVVRSFADLTRWVRSELPIMGDVAILRDP